VIFNSGDKKFLSDSVDEVISSYAKVMQVRRPGDLEAPAFSGSKKAALTVIGTYPIEVKILSPGSLNEKGADLVIQCGGQTDISENDCVDIDGSHFIVSHVNPHVFGGVTTHMEINLEKDVSYGS